MTGGADDQVTAGGFRSIVLRSRREPTLRREADMMGFTVCIVLLAALTAGNDHEPHTRLDVLAIVWGATLGLAVTHWFALMLSVRLVRDPGFTYSPVELLFAQTAMAVFVALVASVTVLSLSEDFDRLGARIAAAVCLGGLVAIESRSGGASRGRSVAFGAGAVLLGVAIATAKWFIGR